jgi:hypothetical protein
VLYGESPYSSAPYSSVLVTGPGTYYLYVSETATGSDVTAQGLNYGSIVETATGTDSSAGTITAQVAVTETASGSDVITVRFLWIPIDTQQTTDWIPVNTH